MIERAAQHSLELADEAGVLRAAVSDLDGSRSSDAGWSRPSKTSRRTRLLSVEISPRRVYVHEPARVHWTMACSKLADDVANRYRYQDIEVQAAWLDEFPGVERLDQELSGDTYRTCNRKLIRAAFDGEHARSAVAALFVPRLRRRLGKATLPCRCCASASSGDALYGSICGW